MSIYAYVDPTADQGEALFWSLVEVVAAQAGVTEGDAFMHMRRAWSDRFKDLKPHHAIDHQGDGRSAIWRVRLSIWAGPAGDSLWADTDDGRQLDQEGATLLAGLPAVSAWVREMCSQAHPGATLQGLEEITLASKIKSLRVSLSNQGGACIWRLRYIVTPPEPPAVAVGGNRLKSVAPSREPQRFMAHVRISREESPRRN